MTDEQLAEAAYAVLHDRLKRIPPACNGLTLFTQDDLTRADEIVLESICRSCPLLAPCRAYADLARPPAGYWAGRRRRSHTNRKETIA